MEVALLRVETAPLGAVMVIAVSVANWPEPL